MQRPRPIARPFASCVALLFGWTVQTLAQSSARVREPLPLDVAADVFGHNGRSPIALSPDGQWVVHSVETIDTVPRATHQYSATGFPFAEGDSRMQATVTNMKTGESIALGGSKSSSWAGVWSPDGTKVAFYSDEGGESGVWIWSLATRRAERFPGVIARPFFGYEIVRWSTDGQRLLCKIVPAGMSLAEITALGMSLEEKRKFEKAGPGQPSVIVKKSEPSDKPAAGKPTPEVKPKTQGDVSWGISDLALLDLKTKKVTRLVERANVRFYGFSPDEKRVACTVLKGWQANSQQPAYDLDVVDLATHSRKTIAREITLGYGIEWNWTPDGRNVAYIPSGIAGKGTAGPIVVVPVDGGEARTLKAEGVPSFDPGEGEYAPVSDENGQNFYAVGNGELWRVDTKTGKGSAVGKIPGWKIVCLVQPFARRTLLSPDGRTVWVLARLSAPTAEGSGVFASLQDGGKAGIFAVDVKTATSRAVVEEAKSYMPIFNLDGNSKTGEIVFVATDQQHLHDLWVVDSRTGKTRQVTHLNPQMERYELGEARLIDWRSMIGEKLRGALLLPPGYKPGRRLPLVVFVYGGDYGSRYLNRFGFWSLGALNCHVLATRGFAVLAPDAPIRDGTPMEDLMGTVLPGVNAAIDQGYADPDRLAVMGQSYGSVLHARAHHADQPLQGGDHHGGRPPSGPLRRLPRVRGLDRLLREGTGQHARLDLGAARPVLPQLAAVSVRPDRDPSPDRAG